MFGFGVDPAHAIFLVVFGVAVGTYGALVGAGGGFLIVPMLLLVFGDAFTAQQAVGTSLLTVFLNGASGALSYARLGRIDYRTGWRFALVSVPGSIAGAYLAQFMTSRAFVIAFGALLVVLAVFMVLRPREAEIVALEEAGAVIPPRRWYVRRSILDRSGRSHHYEYHQPGGLALSFFVGLLGSVLGIGGGIVYMPALVYVFSFPVVIATATSTFILAISSLVGTVSHVFFGNVQFGFAILLGFGVIFGAQFGALLSQYLRGPWIVRLLSVALVVAGIRLILRGVEL
ncbi:MAG TPA: sulfite exporter TauE/SafE family protein [Dehalococcoidia bacterium]|nr:sulfite exporter TauE/SafE family protein [Dehalococcoidia bacterium]